MRKAGVQPDLAHQAQRGQRGAGVRAVVGRVVGEHGGAVEGAVVLGEVQPALEPMRARAPDANAHDVRGAAQGMSANQASRKSTEFACRPNEVQGQPPEQG